MQLSLGIHDFLGEVERKNVKILCCLGAGHFLRPLPSVTKKLIINQTAEYYSKQRFIFALLSLFYFCKLAVPA